MRIPSDPEVLMRTIEILERPGSAATPEQVAALRAMLPVEPDPDGAVHDWWTVEDVMFKVGRSEGWLYLRVNRGDIERRYVTIDGRKRAEFCADDVIREDAATTMPGEFRPHDADPERRVPEHLRGPFLAFVAGVYEGLNAKRRVVWIGQQKGAMRRAG